LAFAAEQFAGMTHAKQQREDPTEHPTDLDSHSDTCVVRKHALILHTLNKKVNITGFDPRKAKFKTSTLF
jgi:hypothetical protein